MFQKKDLLLSLVNCHVHSLEILQHKSGKMEDVVLSSTSLNGIFQGVQLDSYKKFMLKEFLTEKD
jgi:predicted acylesterase/phospholipase RssA